ncbi:hypothetical protein ZIOFF_048639 [Zingiber officinale]|uniref:Lipoxygenase n=1 Tax=Zingiber officinale TaxID=94328 RepID=A0A8J5FQW8_ZINOF|nr:hypothetical protein ZIOFF_048639 [Zingiber officinale]
MLPFMIHCCFCLLEMTHGVLGSAVPAGIVAVEATVVLMKKEVLELKDFTPTLVDNVQELLSSFQLVSATVGDPKNGNRGVVGEKAYLEDFVSKLPAIAAGESTFRVTFKWVVVHGVPGAVIVINEDSSEFYLKSITLEEFPGEGRIHFVCNSWVYPQVRYKYQRVFFANKLYEGGLPVVNNPLIDKLRERIPFEMIRELFRAEGNRKLLKFPLPQVIQEDKYAWRTDEEFTREMLAGVNPVNIRRLEEFPPVSKFDESKYGDHKSTIKAADIEHNLEGLTIEEALGSNRLFILDHHDSLMPYLNRINDTANKVYATRTLLFLRDDSTLKPLAIELSLPHPDGEQHGAVSEVYTPADSGVEASVWQLAKAYVTVNDSGVHQLISHWLNTYATMEPFVIATNRHLSVLHPINKLLAPHYRGTMNINASARQTLINAGGIIEQTFFPAKYAMEISAVVYKSWNFVEQGLPADLIKRRLLRHLLPNDAVVRADAELQAWWKEVRVVGHGDKKHEPWWPKLETVIELMETCTTIIWVASALHAAVNFGQYPYAGYHPNRPTLCRKFMPERGTEEFAELERDPDKVFLHTITNRQQTILGVSVIEILSMHSTDEVYLGHRDTAEWTADRKALEAFERFGAALRGIEVEIVARNGEGRFKNRNGPVKVPYTLLYPTSGAGLTGKGIPSG